MSTGMKQKLALAATLAADTPIYILDEPTANLDPTVRATVLAHGGRGPARGKTVLFSSHVLSEVEEVCDRVVILRAGRLVHTQVMSQLRLQHRIVAQLTRPAAADSRGVARPARHRRSQRQRRGRARNAGRAAPLLGWLATLPLADVRIEPVGLRADVRPLSRRAAGRGKRRA